MASSSAARMEVWMTDFGAGRGHEQAGLRPSVVVPHDGFNQSAADLVIVIPITSKAKGIRTHVPHHDKLCEMRGHSVDFQRPLVQKDGCRYASHDGEHRVGVESVACSLVFDAAIVRPPFIGIEAVHQGVVE